MGRARAAHGDGETGRLEHRRHGATRPFRQRALGVRGAQLLEDLLLALAEELGKDAVDHDGRHAHRGLLPHPLLQLEGLVHRHLLGRAHGDQSGLAGIREDVEHPVGLAADQPDLDQIIDGLRSRQLADDVAAGRGVHHHQVVMGFPYFPAELADGEDLAHPRRRRRHEVERLGQRPDPSHHGNAQVQLEVLA